MSLTRLTKAEAEGIAAEALAQGWAHQIGYDINQSTSQGIVELIGPMLDSSRNEVWVVELKFPCVLGPKYNIRTLDEWRRLKAKTDEIRQIIAEARERGWEIDSWGDQPMVRGDRRRSQGMYITVFPPGTHKPYGKRVGGMRTWRMLCREYDDVIEASVSEPAALRETGS